MNWLIPITVRHPHGLHMRVAATMVDILSRILSRPELERVFLHANRHTVQVIDLIAVVSLKITQGDLVHLSIQGQNSDCLGPAVRYLEQLPVESPQVEAVDDIIQKWAMHSQAILDNMVLGLLVVNHANRISFLNRTARNYLSFGDNSTYVGRDCDEVLPEFRMSAALSRTISTTEKLVVGSCSVLVTCAPIFVDKQLHGAMATFREVSDFEALAEELKTVKSLKARYDLVLQLVQDGICVTDSQGLIQYVNPAYEEIYGVKSSDVLNKSVMDDWYGLKALVHQHGSPAYGNVNGGDGQEVFEQVKPIRVDTEFKGVLSISRRMSDVRELLSQLAELKQETELLKERLSEKESLAPPFREIVGISSALHSALQIANKAARTQSTVLITGESGTGKELVARAIHHSSPRNNGPFVRVNCAAIPLQLIESELFGHERGAFTGAVSARRGKFEMAQGGTLFLDEIGELPLEVQAKLLRVLQEREVERVGGSTVIPLDVRIIAATNRDLWAEVQTARFREDLYYRINVVQVLMPPLRRRKEDIPMLVETFLRELQPVVGKTVTCSEETMRVLQSYDWPGNTRELKNVIEQAMNLSDQLSIQLKHLPHHMQGRTVFPSPRTKGPSERIRVSGADARGSAPPDDIWFSTPLQSMEYYEQLIIAKALQQYPSFNAAAKVLGLSHKTVAAKARKYGLVELNNPLRITPKLVKMSNNKSRFL